MNVLSVVCARAGSKGLDNKCIARIQGRMVVEYSICYSMALGDAVKTVVSTDIEEVIDYCENNGIDFIKRDPELCTDESKIDAALADAIEKDQYKCSLCSLVYGNIPLRYPKLFRQAVQFLSGNMDYDAVLSMQNVEKFNPEWMFDYNEDVLPRVQECHYQRQMLPQKMIHDGHTVIFRTMDFIKKFNGETPYGNKYRCSIFGEKIKPQINNEVIIDIDTEKDFRLAEALLTNRVGECWNQ